jgi:nitroimidazol reductase NimA-like FMN-containing flavoprotein (pyridoxamine 5'-phosphate oxidase superfamily)
MRILPEGSDERKGKPEMLWGCTDVRINTAVSSSYRATLEIDYDRQEILEGGPSMTKRPEFLELTAADCATVLERNHLGRVAFLRDGRVDIEPVGYAAQGDWIFVRSAQGAKLEAFAHNPYVAFEVDEVDGPFDWRSVVAHGTIYMLPADGAPIEQREFERALRALRSIMPDALTKSDPVPERTVVYGLHIDRQTGRMARSGKRGGGKKRVAKRTGKSPRARSGI